MDSSQQVLQTNGKLFSNIELVLEFLSENIYIYIYIYIYLKTTEKLNTSQITLVEKYNLIEIVEGQVTKRLGLALFIQ